MSKTILDHIDNISVDGDVFQTPYNEYWAVLCLWDGMEFLYKQVARCESELCKSLNPDNTSKTLLLGNPPELQNLPKKLITSAFHWYAVSACQYVRTIGTIGHRLDNSRPTGHDYAYNIIPEVVVFRDKVAAHFSWLTKNNHDNHAEREVSVFPNLGFENDSLYMSQLTLATKGSSSEEMKPWSLCKIHEELRKRYWPEQKQPDPATSAG